MELNSQEKKKNNGIVFLMMVILLSSFVSAGWFSPEAPPPFIYNNNTNITVNIINANGANISGDVYMNNNTIWNAVFANSTFLANASNISHNSLFGLQGGSAPNEYYHLNASEYNTVAYENTSVQFINITAGYFIGNGSMLTGITGGGNGTVIESNVSLNYVWNGTNWTGMRGTRQGILQIDVDSIRTNDYWGLVSGRLYFNGSAEVADNFTAAHFIGNGSLLTGIVTTDSFWNITTSQWLINNSNILDLNESLLNLTIDARDGFWNITTSQWLINNSGILDINESKINQSILDMRTNESYNYVWNGSNWIGMAGTSTGILKVELSGSSTVHGNLNVTGNLNVSGCIHYNGGTLGVCI